MEKKSVEYGTTHPVTVDSADEKLIVVIADDIKEGFLLMGHGEKVLPKKGDKGIIVFTKGGAMKGYWRYVAKRNIKYMAS